MRVLIAGCGDVGNVLAVSLIHEGHVVYGLKRDISSLPAGVEPVKADLTDPDTLADLPTDIEGLVFMPTPASRDPAGYEAIFIEGWKNLWFALRNTPVRTLVVSSTAVFGESAGGLVDERSVPGPTGFNGKILLEMEHIAGECTKELVIVRISGIYGPGRERLIRQAATGGLEVQQTPPYFTNRIHRDDAAAVLKHLLFVDEPETVYIASDDLPAPRYEVVEWLAKVQGANSPKGLIAEHASRGKRVNNQRLKDSGFTLSYPDYRVGYGAVLSAK